MECGYIVEGVNTERLQTCPDCGAPGQALEFFPYGDDDEEDWGEEPVEDKASADEASAGELFDDEDEELR